MNRQQLSDKIEESHRAFIHYINTLTDEEFVSSYNNKWSAGQQLEHILLSLTPLTQAFMLPGFIIKVYFGKANRPGKTYDELVNKYVTKLQAGGQATGNFVPKPVSLSQKEKLVKAVNNAVNKLNRQINSFSETQLDQLILPHPLLGKLTVREMIYFTIYHVEHHHHLIQRDLKATA
jgi:hypothetical protein